MLILTASSSPARRWKSCPLSRWNTGRSFAGLWSGRKPMFTAHCTFAGAHRRRCIIIMGCRRSCCRKSCLGYSGIRWFIKIPFCSGASMMNFGCPIPGIPPSAGRTWRPFQKSRFSPLLRRRDFMPCPPNMGTSCLSPDIRNTTRRR